MKRKLFFVLFVLVMVGLSMQGCKGKQSVNTQQGKEKVEAVTFDPAKVLSKNTAGYVDVVEPEKVSTAGIIHAAGWAYDPQKELPAKGVVIVADGKQHPMVPQTGLKRDDVGKELRNDSLTNTGWEASFSASSLGVGKHKLEFYASLHDGMFAPLRYKTLTYVEIEVIGK